MLPDLSRLASWPAERWRALGARLRDIGLVAAHDQVARIGGENAFWPSVRPLRAWHLRRRADPASHAIRALMYGDPVTEPEARAAFGDAASLDDLLDGGLLVRADGDRVVSPLVLHFSGDVLFFGDNLRHGGDAVMSLGRMTVSLARAAMPAERVGRALDLGCGAGVCALLLASRVDHVVATDINPRAAVLAAANAAMNDIHNVEVRRGDLFAPVAGEEFDVIVSQPPFVPKPDESADTVYMFGGRRGDELPLRALAEAPACLRPGGRSSMIVAWPVFDGDEDMAARVRRVVPRDDVDVLVVDGPGPDPDESSIAEAALDHPGLDAAYERHVLSLRAHAERIGLRGVRDTLTVLARRERGAAFTATFPVPSLTSLMLRGDQVGDLLAAHAILSGGPAALLAARLRLPQGTALERVTASRLRYPEGYLLDGLEIDAGVEAVVRALHDAPTAGDAVRRLARDRGVTYESALRDLGPVLERIVASGAVRVEAG